MRIPYSALRPRGLKLLSASLFITLMSCTGSTYLNTYGIKGNTHPVKEYGEFSIIFKGGWIYHGNSIPGQAGGGDYTGDRITSRACSHSYLYMISLGNSSIQEACRKEKITQVISTQHDITALLGGILYHRHCTTVVGVSDGSWSDPEEQYR